MFFFSCHHLSDSDHKNDQIHQEQTHDQDAEEDHGQLPSLSYTIYTDSIELFVEFPPLIAHKTSTFAAHFTRLSDFNPIKEGKLIVHLNGETSQSVHIENLSAPGIFNLSLIPETSGTFQLVFKISSDDLTDNITIENIMVFPDEETAMMQNLQHPDEGEIPYLKEQAWKTDFATVVIKKQSFFEVIKTTGKILPGLKDEVSIPAKHSGTVVFIKSAMFSGQFVTKHEDLFLISSAGLVDDNVKEKYIRSKATFEKCRTDLERAKQLITDKLISQKEFLETNLKYKQAEAIFNTIAINYSDGGEKVTSPATGFISNVFVTEGQYVDMGQTLVKIIKNQKMIIKADVPPQHYAKLNRIHSANFITPYNNLTYDIADLNGKLISYGKSTDRSSFYTPVYFEIENTLTNTTREERLIPGSFIEIYLKAKPIPEAIIVPYSALIEEYEKYFVFVQKTGESFEKREVKLGGRDGENVHVLSGIKENERVVTKGAFRIRLASLSNELPSGGHVH